MKHFALLSAAVLLVSGCRLSVKIKEDHDREAEEMSSSSDGMMSTGAMESSESVDPPPPTTSTSTGAGTSDTDDTSDLPDLPNDATPVEIVTFSADINPVKRAGPVRLTAEVVGDVEHLELEVFHEGSNFHDTITWPVDEPTHDFVVDTSKFNGYLEFKLHAQGETDDMAELELAVDMPPAGSLDQRWELTAGTTGVALAQIPGEGSEPDQIVTVGKQNNGKLIINTLDGDDLSPKVIYEPMEPHAVAYDPGSGVFFVTGENTDGELVLRKFVPGESDPFQYWERTYPNAAGHDVAVGPDGLVYVAGQVAFNSHTEAAIWVFDPDGPLLGEVTYSALDEFNDPRGSSLTGVLFMDNRILTAGARDVGLNGSSYRRAAIFEFTNEALEPVATLTSNYAEEVSGWKGIAASDEHVFTIGWNKPNEVTPQSIAYGRYSLSLTPQMISPAWDGYGVGHAIAWHSTGYPIAAGARADFEPEFWVGATTWELPYLDPTNDMGEARDIVVDRYGYVYVLGSRSENGYSHLVLVRLNP